MTKIITTVCITPEDKKWLKSHRQFTASGLLHEAIKSYRELDGIISGDL